MVSSVAVSREPQRGLRSSARNEDRGHPSLPYYRAAYGDIVTLAILQHKTRAKGHLKRSPVWKHWPND